MLLRRLKRCSRISIQSKNDKKTRTQLIFFIRAHILPEAMPGEIRLHKPGEGLQVGNYVRLLNPTTFADNPRRASACDGGA